MKTAISIPDELFHRADALALALGKSRSQVYREALAEYLLRRDADSITSSLDAVVSDLDGEPDPWLAAAGRSALERTEW